MSGNPIQFYTILARNYAAQAATLAESLRAQHPEAEFTAWLIDEGDVVPAAASCTYRHVSEIVSPLDMLRLKLRYELMEFATAVKPCVASHLFAEGAEKVCYIDPDIYFFRPMTKVMDALDDGATGVLLPHILSPIPRDGMSPSDKDILKSGVYNLGFIGLGRGEETDRFLEWWWQWLQTDCFADPRTGVFTDQKWVNFATVFFQKFVVVPDPAYNVAYWNLHERSLEKDPHGGWTINGAPLVFFHYSGFDYRTPTVLSKHQTRVKVTSWSKLGEMLAFYEGRMRFHGADEARRTKVPRIQTVGGEKIDSVAMGLLDRAAHSHPELLGLDTLGQDRIREYLADVEPGQRYGRYVTAVLDLRPDVAKQYQGAPPEAIMHWLETSGASEMDLNPALARWVRREGCRIGYAGYFRSALGVSEAARGYSRALAARDYDVVPVDLSHLTHLKEDAGAYDRPVTHDFPRDAKLTVLHVNADQVVEIVNRAAVGDVLSRSYTVGIWAWETQDLPERMRPAFDLVDEVWVCSGFVAEAVARHSPVPVVVIPHVVTVPEAKADRGKFGLDPNEFVFLFTFDFLSYSERKNPADLLMAFRAAFDPSEPVRLLMKSHKGEQFPEKLEALKHMAAGVRVSFLDEALTSEDRYCLLNSCDAYVSLHRAEGFGLGMAEAMAYGKPVVATGWSGNMEFMSAWNAFLVDFSLENLPHDIGPYPKGTTWAKPDLDDAARVMRKVWVEDDLRAKVGQRAAADIALSLSEETVGALLDQRVQHVLESRTGRAKQEATIVAGVPNLKRKAFDQAIHNPGWALRNLPKALAVLRREGLTGLKRRLAARFGG